MLTNLLSTLGSHAALILIGCVEFVAAIVLLGVLPHTSKSKAGAAPALRAGASALLQALDRQDDQCLFVFRRQDQYPLYMVGRLSILPQLTLPQLRKDIACVLQGLDDAEEGRRFWQNYLHWDGASPLKDELRAAGGEWLSISVQRCPGRSMTSSPWSAPPPSTSGTRSISSAWSRPSRPASSRPASCSGCPTRSAPR